VVEPACSRRSPARPCATLGRARSYSAYLFAVYAYIQPVGYRHTYPTDTSRRAFAESFAGNPGLRLLYGQPHQIDTTAGYTAWRVGGVLAIVAAAYGLLAAVRAGRADEESGRTEVVLAAPVSRATANTAGLLAIAAGIALLWVAEFVGLVAASIPAGGAAYFALATAMTGAVFTGIGAVASQLVPTRRGALGLGAAALGVLFLLRILADTVSGAGWLRWATPLGWAELLRPLTDPAPLVLLLPLLTTGLLLVVAAGLARRRDIGAGLLPRRDSADPHLWLLGSSIAQALRGQARVIIAWLAATAAFMTILGVISHSLSTADVPANVQRQIAKLGSGSIVTPTGYIAFLFFFVALAICLFVCTQISRLREDEEQHLESVLAQPVARWRWLGGRLILTAVAAAAIALATGIAAWVGATAAGVHVPLPSLLEAGANALPVAMLFLGLGGLVYALGPSRRRRHHVRPRCGRIPVATRRRPDRPAALGSRPVPLRPPRAGTQSAVSARFGRGPGDGWPGRSDWRARRLLPPRYCRAIGRARSAGRYERGNHDRRPIGDGSNAVLLSRSYGGRSAARAPGLACRAPLTDRPR
jgi:ABC-2 type transport system permease protein